MRVLRYPAAALAGDYARAAAGLAMTGLPLGLGDPTPWLAVPLGLCAVLFAVFGVRTLQRQLTGFVADADGVRAEGPFGAALPWAALTALRLRFYAARRDRSRGWMQMTLAGPGVRLRVESTLDGFDGLVERAAAAARANGVALDAATVDNLLALGIDPEAAAPGDSLRDAT